MKALQLLVLTAILTTPAYAEILCSTKPAASCLGEDGICTEFFEESGTDEEMWEGMCDSSEGTYSSAPCDASKVAVKCLVAANSFMPVINFLSTDFSTEDAVLTCTMMQGKVCE